MIREIVKDEEFLARPCEPATADDVQIVQDLLDTMESLGDSCACLAANQIGEEKAIIAYEFNGRLYVMLNPKIERSAIAFNATESCMSLERESQVRRYRRIVVSYDVIEDGELVHRKRKLQDFNAEVVQHAIDHCNGVVV